MDFYSRYKTEQFDQYIAFLYVIIIDELQTFKTVFLARPVFISRKIFCSCLRLELQLTNEKCYFMLRNVRAVFVAPAASVERPWERAVASNSVPFYIKYVRHRCHCLITCIRVGSST